MKRILKIIAMTVLLCIVITGLYGAAYAQSGSENQAEERSDGGAELNGAAERTATYTICCIGDSLTYGAMPYTVERRKTTYPDILASLLGKGYEVTNYGKCGRSLISSGLCYLNEPEYRESVRSAADMYIIMLGTNDVSLGEKWNAEEYERNLNKVVDAYRKANPDTVIVLIAPPTVLPNEKTGEYRVDISLLEGFVRDTVQKVASEKDALYMDLFEKTTDHPEWIGADGIHFTQEGYEAFGHFVYNNIKEILFIYPIADAA